MKKHHVSMKISVALSLTDEELEIIFLGNGNYVRNELLERQRNGELLIGSEGCEGFDPITGCPGHQEKTESPC